MTAEVLPAAANAVGAFDYDGLDTETRIVVQQRTSEIKALVFRLSNSGEELPPDLPSFDPEDLVPTSYPCRIVTTRELREQDGRPVVYALSDPRDGRLFYVGKSRQIKKRMAAHCLIRPQYPRSSPMDKLKYAIYRDGTCVAAFLLQRCDYDDEALMWEQFFIDRFHLTLLNIQMKRWLPPQPRYEW